jgi:hypothetical protein
MSLLKRTTRFGVFPAFQLRNFYLVWGFSKQRFGFYTPVVETKNGVCKIMAVNIHRFMLMRETPSL